MLIWYYQDWYYNRIFVHSIFSRDSFNSSRSGHLWKRITIRSAYGNVVANIALWSSFSAGTSAISFSSWQKIKWMLTAKWAANPIDSPSVHSQVLGAELTMSRREIVHRSTSVVCLHITMKPYCRSTGIRHCVKNSWISGEYKSSDHVNSIMQVECLTIFFSLFLFAVWNTDAMQASL